MPYQRTGRKPVRKEYIQARTVRTTAVRLRQLQPTAVYGLMFAILLLAAPVLAQTTPAQDSPEADPVAADETVLISDESETPRFVIPPDPKAPYLDAIDRMEAERGPYVSELSDLYLGLGEVFLQSGEYEEARDAYHRGVMVVRVNSGPNSPEQTNLLYLIANIETILEEPKQADKILENIRFINTQHYGENSPELLPVYERMYEWYATTRPLDVEESKLDNYRQIVELTEDMVELNETVNGPDHPGTALAYRRLAEAHFESLRFAMHEEDWIAPRIVVGSDTPYQSLMATSDVSPRDHYIDGRNAYLSYLEIIEADPNTSALEHAEAIADLADWSLHFEKYRAARKLYAQAYQVLADSEEYAQLVDNYLGDPKPMSFSGFRALQADGNPLDEEAKRVDISMTVTRVGDVRTIEILNPPEDMSEDALHELTKELQDTPFRPSLREGKAVTTEGFIWQHVIRIEPLDAARPEERTS